MDKILIDTDVILDFFFDRLPFSNHSSKVLSLCEEKKIDGFVTPLICSNTYYLLRKTARHQKVIEKLKQLLIILDVLSIDKNIVIQALNSGFNDFEDALQNYSAEKFNSINVIITRNVKDYKRSNLAVLTPANYLSKLYN